MDKNVFALIILDGFGIGENNPISNAILKANPESIISIAQNGVTTTLDASGLAVGLPDGQMGNSEVGHTNIGAGRIVYQELTRITKSISDGDFFENPSLLSAVGNAKKHGSSLHLIGLVSDGGVHSHEEHLYALLELCKREGLKNVFIHAITDGRDTPPKSSDKFLARLESKISEIGVGKVASVAGRFYAMDRDNRWDRVEKAYNCFCFGEGESFSSSAECIREQYEKGVTDEFLVPSHIDGGKTISPNDSVIFFNFRPDRARELSHALTDQEFSSFQRKNGFFPLTYITMTSYDKSLSNVSVAFKPESLRNTMGEYISSLGLNQLRIAETEKYAHVTFFFNGGRETPYENEDRILIPSPKVATYDLKPEMSALEVTDRVCQEIMAKRYDLIVLNLANCDMVGHTGVFDAAVSAVKTVDKCVARIKSALDQVGGAGMIIADHGNADLMLEDDGKTPFTAHTTNPVPCILFGKDIKGLDKGGRLCDVSPTILELMGLPIPEEMTGRSLVIR